MKHVFKIGVVVGALVMMLATMAPMMMVHAQFPNQHPDGVQMPPASEAAKNRAGGPVAIGQQMLTKDDGGKVALLQSAPPSGGVIQLSAFGWLEPYFDSAVQGIIVIFCGWFGKSALGKMLDQSARDALEVFLKNAASSLLADGAVEMRGKVVKVDSIALAKAADTANRLIPGALKRFGITPQLVADKIVDAIPQTPAGAEIVAAAHEPEVPMPIAGTGN